jgi:hypothetical protein
LNGKGKKLTSKDFLGGNDDPLDLKDIDPSVYCVVSNFNTANVLVEKGSRNMFHDLVTRTKIDLRNITFEYALSYDAGSSNYRTA